MSADEAYNIIRRRQQQKQQKQQQHQQQQQQEKGQKAQPSSTVETHAPGHGEGNLIKLKLKGLKGFKEDQN